MPDGHASFHDTLSGDLMPRPLCSTYHGAHVHPSLEIDNPMIETLLRNIDARLGCMDKRFDLIDKRFDRMDERFDRMDARFEKMDARFDKMDERFERVETRLGALDVAVASVGSELKGLEFRTCRVETAVDRFNETVIGLSERVGHAQAHLVLLGEMRMQTAQLNQRVGEIAARINTIPTWRGLVTGAAATVAASATSVTWLIQGGAKAMARWFE
ncbi:hypothetical protein [Luteibacter yeojuensis]|uniref:hypothetical protein n=1 Tax=Luteibacter yeojuensis TaxID=345309 RepID=UPI000696260D|nr:hypothetical protein [Luteibacter yeojuensis]